MTRSLKTSYIDSASKMPIKRDCIMVIHRNDTGFATKRAQGVFQRTRSLGRSKLADKGKVLFVWAIDVALLTSSNSVIGVNLLGQICRRKQGNFLDLLEQPEPPVMAHVIGDQGASVSPVSVDFTPKNADNIAFEIFQQYGGGAANIDAAIETEGTLENFGLDVALVTDETPAVNITGGANQGAPADIALASTVIGVKNGIVNSDIRRYEFETPMIFVEPVILQTVHSYVEVTVGSTVDFGSYWGMDYTELVVEGEQYRRLLDAYTELA